MMQQSAYLYENVIKISNYLEESNANVTLKVFLTAFFKRFTAILIDHSDNSN